MRATQFRPVLNALDQRVVPAIYTVDDSGGADFTSIQAAVDKAATTTANDTILVRPGTYTEQVRITEDDLALRATGRQDAIIQAPTGLTPFSILVAVSGDDVVVDGFWVRGPGDAPNALDVGIGVGGGAKDVVIRNNLVTDIGTSPLGGSQTSAAVLITGAAAEVVNNTVRRYEKGGIVVVDDGTDGSAVVRGNTVVGSGPTARNAQYGIQVSDGADAVVTGNTVSRNVFTPAGTEAAGVVVQAAGRVTVADNKLAGNEVGVLVEDQTAGLVVRGNRIDGSTLDGISLTNTKGAAVIDNRVADSDRDGIRLTDTSSAAVLGNRVEGSGRWGVALTGTSSFNLVALNRINDSGARDVFVGPDATSNLVFGNR